MKHASIHRYFCQDDSFLLNCLLCFDKNKKQYSVHSCYSLTILLNDGGIKVVSYHTRVTLSFSLYMDPFDCIRIWLNCIVLDLLT